MALLCLETDSVPRSFPDKTILNDKRVMENLLAAEEPYILASDYFANKFQDDIRPNMRKTVVEWMFEVRTNTFSSPSFVKKCILLAVFNKKYIL